MPGASPVRYASNGDLSIAYEVEGDGPIDLLFIPGFVSNLDILKGFRPAVRFFGRLSSFARVIRFDKRGQGLSDAGPYTLEGVASDAIAVLDAVGSERAALFGVSEGGCASTLLAATRPDRIHSMVQYGTYAKLAATPDFPGGIDLEELRQVWGRMTDNWSDPSSLRLFAPSSADDPELLEWWGRLLRSGASPAVARTLADMYEQVDVRPLLGSVKVPTLIMYREGDRLVPPAISRVVADGIPGAKAIELPGNDHLFLAGDQDAMLDEIEEFLTGRPPERAADRVLATVLFVDIVDSTVHAARLGDRAWRRQLERGERDWRREVARRGGRVVKSTGDGLLATFDGPTQAVRAALAIAEASRTSGLMTRAGVHTGECELMGGDIGGIAVHIASRIEGTAPPGEVVATGTVKDLSIGSGLEFEDRGERELKGVPGAWRIYAVSEGVPTRV